MLRAGALLAVRLQLRLENYFRATRKLGTTYWTGLIKNANLYYWPDGTVVNNGATSNANPYAHFPYNYQDRLARYPTYTYTLATSTNAYSNYTGGQLAVRYHSIASAPGQNCLCSALVWPRPSVLLL